MPYPLVGLTGMAAFCWGSLPSAHTREPIRLHPENPHYFLFRGKPTVLVTAAEHYGAVINLDWLDTKYGLDKAIAFDETNGTPHHAAVEDARVEAWEHFVGGGAVYSHLSWHYTPSNAAGSGTETLRQQLRVLKDFIHGLDFISMKPDKSLLKAGLPDGTYARAQHWTSTCPCRASTTDLG
jgi:DNA polymerase III epsilon subunit-like protein